LLCVSFVRHVGTYLISIVHLISISNLC